jgi:hypothetical protein
LAGRGRDARAEASLGRHVGGPGEPGRDPRRARQHRPEPAGRACPFAEPPTTPRLLRPVLVALALDDVRASRELLRRRRRANGHLGGRRPPAWSATPSTRCGQAPAMLGAVRRRRLDHHAASPERAPARSNVAAVTSPRAQTPRRG